MKETYEKLEISVKYFMHYRSAERFLKYKCDIFISGTRNATLPEKIQHKSSVLHTYFYLLFLHGRQGRIKGRPRPMAVNFAIFAIFLIFEIQVLKTIGFGKQEKATKFLIS